jgi:hypothetical protein
MGLQPSEATGLPSNDRSVGGAGLKAVYDGEPDLLRCVVGSYMVLRVTTTVLLAVEISTHADCRMRLRCTSQAGASLKLCDVGGQSKYPIACAALKCLGLQYLFLAAWVEPTSLKSHRKLVPALVFLADVCFSGSGWSVLNEGNDRNNDRSPPNQKTLYADKAKEHLEQVCGVFAGNERIVITVTLEPWKFREGPYTE